MDEGSVHTRARRTPRGYPPLRTPSMLALSLPRHQGFLGWRFVFGVCLKRTAQLLCNWVTTCSECTLYEEVTDWSLFPYVEKKRTGRVILTTLLYSLNYHRTNPNPNHYKKQLFL